MQKNIHVAYACDRKSIKICSISMLSVLMNKNKDEYIHFYFIADDTFSSTDLSYLDILTTESSSLTILYVDQKHFVLYRKTTKRKELPVNAYYRLGIPRLLPNLDKVIYLDYDTIVLTSLWEVYCTDISGYFFAAVEDAWKYKRARELAVFQRQMRHYNTGFLLFNIKEWILNKVDEKLIAFSQNHTNIFILADQFLLNTVVNKNIFYLPLEWNLQIPRKEYGEPLEYDDMVAWEKAIVQPKIIHYNFRKPWQFSQCTNRYFHLWWKYARLTPYYESILCSSIAKELENRNKTNKTASQKEIKPISRRKKFEKLAVSLMPKYMAKFVIPIYEKILKK